MSLILLSLIDIRAELFDFGEALLKLFRLLLIRRLEEERLAGRAFSLQLLQGCLVSVLMLI